MKRVFLGWDAPALPRAAAALCDHYENGDEVLRLDRALVALPGARAGRRLKELLVAEAQRRGVPLVPPRVTTVGAVPELLYESPRPIATPVAGRRVWAEVLQAFDRDALATLFARLPDADALPEWSRLGRELHSLHRDVAAGGLRFADVAGRCRDSPLYDDSRRWRMLARVQADYEARLAALGLADIDLARLDVLAAAAASHSAGAGSSAERRIGTDLDLWIVGAAEMPGVVRQMIVAADRAAEATQAGATRSTATALIHAPHSRAAAFDDLGCVIPAAWLEAEIPLDEERLDVVDGPEDQADVVADTLRALDGRFAADEIVLGVPDREMVPYLEQRLEGGGVPTRAAAGKPISRTGPFRLLTAVADYLDGRRFDTLATLARDPDLGRWLIDPDADVPGLRRADGWLGALDRWYNDHLPARIGDSRNGGAGREGAARAAVPAPEPGSAGDQLELGFGIAATPEPYRSRRGEDRATVWALIRRIDGMVSEITDPTSSAGTAGLAHWAERSLKLLEKVYGTRRLDPDVPAHRRLIRTLDRIGRAARSVIELPEALDVRCAAPQALRLLLDEAAAESVPPAGERAAVELLGWLELHLDDAPVAVVTGMNEPHVPESVSAHAFLPDHLRTRLGLEDNDRRYARDAYQLTAALHARPHLRLVAGRRAASGDPLRPSRLLFATTPDAAARRVRRFYDEEVRERGAAAPRAASALSSRSTFVLPPQPVITAPKPMDRLRATDFSALLADPYIFALNRVLGLDSLDDDAREMDPLRFGTLGHRVLERFGGDREVVNVADVDIARRRLDELLDHEVARRFGEDAHVAVGIQVAQLRSRLHAFARWHADWIGQGWNVVAAECGTPDEGIPLEVDGVPCGITARIDRVDHRSETGEWAVFDYKTGDRGKSPNDTHRTNRDTEWADLQLPLYRWLLPQLTDDEGDPVAPGAATAPISVGYITLCRDLESIGAKFAEWPDALFEDAMERARDLVRLVRANRFEHDPSVRPRYPDPPLEALIGLGHLAGEAEEQAAQLGAE